MKSIPASKAGLFTLLLCFAFTYQLQAQFIERINFSSGVSLSTFEEIREFDNEERDSKYVESKADPAFQQSISIDYLKWRFLSLNSGIGYIRKQAGGCRHYASGIETMFTENVSFDTRLKGELSMQNFDFCGTIGMRIDKILSKSETFIIPYRVDEYEWFNTTWGFRGGLGFRYNFNLIAIGFDYTRDIGLNPIEEGHIQRIPSYKWRVSDRSHMISLTLSLMPEVFKKESD